MENHSFEGEPPSGNSPNDPKDNPPGPSKPRTDCSSDNKDQVKEGITTSVSVIKNNPAYAGIISPEQKTDDSEGLELPPLEPVQEPCVVRSGPELQQQTDGRTEGIETVRSAEESRSLRREPSYTDLFPISRTYPPPPNIPLPPIPIGYSNPSNINLPPVPEPNPSSYSRQQVANVGDPGQQVANVGDPGQQVANVGDPGQQVANVGDPGQQVANVGDHGQQVANVGDPGQQAPSALSRIGETCVDYYNRINVFAFQLPFHAFLLTWPLATAIMGALSVIYCSMNPYLPSVMLTVGLLGTGAGVLRIYVLLYEKGVKPARPINFWPLVQVSEFLIWILFVFQLYCFFEQSPSFIPGTKHYCKPKIFMLNLGLICLAFATMIGWIVINTGVLIHWILRKNARSRT